MKNMIKLLCSSFLLTLLVACGGDSSLPPVHPSPSKIDASAVDYEPIVQQFFIGYFGRPADPGELAYYTAAFRSAIAPKTLIAMDAAYNTNTALQNLIESFATTEESANLYPNSSYIGDDYTFITAVYINLFNRGSYNPGPTDNVSFWATQLNQHQMTRAKAMLSIMANATGGDAGLSHQNC